MTALILGAAFALRLTVAAHVLHRYPADWLFARGSEMSLLAQSVLAGRGLSDPFGPHTGPTAFIAPGYPLLIAAVFFLFGAGSKASALCILILQSLLNVLTAWLIMRLARRLGGQRAAVLAGITAAMSPPLLWMPTILWETSFSACLLLAFVSRVLHTGSDASRREWLLLGAAAACTGLINPALLPCCAAVCAWRAIAATRTNRLRAGLALMAFIVVYSAWPIRNAIAFHAFIPLRTTVGYELWMGNRAGATGFLDESLFPTFNRAELADYSARGELGYTQHKTQLAIAYMRSYPRRTLALTALRALRFWMGTGTSGGSMFFALHAMLTSLLGVFGLLRLARHRRALAALLGFPLLLFSIPYYLTHAEFRYRLVVDPLLIALSAYAVAEPTGTTSADADPVANATL